MPSTENTVWARCQFFDVVPWIVTIAVPATMHVVNSFSRSSSIATMIVQSGDRRHSAVDPGLGPSRD